jgi:hypothetical protein
MPVTKNRLAHLYLEEDWSSTERIQLEPGTRVLLTGVSSGEGWNRYLLVWAHLESERRLQSGWLWEQRIEPTSLAPVVPLRQKYPRGDGRDKTTYKLYYTQRSRRYKNNLIEKLEAIQQLLADPAFVQFALDHLEAKTAEIMANLTCKPTTALDMALAELESQWALEERMTLRTTAKSKKPSSRHPNELTLLGEDGPLAFQRQFLQKAVKQAVPIRDIGAPVSHGEYAHRLQWYIIAYYFLDGWTDKGIRYVHHAMGRRRFLQELESPNRKDDPLRSLWDYVVDIRFNEPQEVGASESVFAASPVRLTSRLLGYDVIAQKLTLGTLSLRYKNIARAVANKRRKRVLDSKQREGKLTQEEAPQLDDEHGWEKRESWLQNAFRELFE